MKKIISLMSAIMIFAPVALTIPKTSTAAAKVNFARPHTTQEEPLTEEEVAALLDTLKEGLPKLVEDEEAVAAIEEKWDAHEDLVGKTGSQILQLLFADVRSVVDDKETLAAIWKDWHEDDDSEEQEAVAAKPAATPAAPAQEQDEQNQEDDEDWSTMDDSRKLNAQNVSWMLEDLEDELSDFIDNQAQIAAIVKKWSARKDLVGKTKADATALLYADVKSIVKDKETLDSIEDSWKVSDAITAPSATKQQQEALDQLKKHLFEEAEKNLDTWKQVFSILQLGGAAEYDPEAVAGFCLMREGSTPDEAWVKSLEGIVAFQKIQNRNLLPAEIEQMKEVTIKLMGCGSNCAAQHKKLKERAVEIFEQYRRAGMMILFVIQLTDKNNMDAFLKGFIQEAYKEYQAMDNYDPYKIEAECRKNGGDELGCFQSTYFGLFGYGLFGKQADEKVQIDQKSVDLVNRWVKERLPKFECVKSETERTVQGTPKCIEIKRKP